MPGMMIHSQPIFMHRYSVCLAVLQLWVLYEVEDREAALLLAALLQETPVATFACMQFIDFENKSCGYLSHDWGNLLMA